MMYCPLGHPWDPNDPNTFETVHVRSVEGETEWVYLYICLKCKVVFSAD